MLTRLLWNASVGTRGYLRRYMPTNVLLDRIHQRQGLKWGIPDMLIGVRVQLRWQKNTAGRSSPG